MKKPLICCLAILLIIATLAGCGPADPAPTPGATTVTTQPTTGPVRDEAYYLNTVYAAQIRRYYTAVMDLWDIGMYLENGMSPLPVNYCAGNPLENVGFGLVDLDGDGVWELIIGATKDHAVFEIWTMENGAPVMLAQSGSDNRYLLLRTQEQTWQIVNEATNNIASFATYYMTLEGGKLKVVQGVVFDAFADEENPWFLTKDLDWDVSNDTPIDEETANDILDSNQLLYAIPEYTAYCHYPSGETPVTPQQQLSERMQALSQRFGLDIRIPKQNEISYARYHADALTDLIAIRTALDLLEQTLSLYPEGFFRQLPYDAIQSIRVELVGEISIKEDAAADTGAAGAFTANMGEYYLVVLNGLFLEQKTIFHEFSHMIDSRISWDAATRDDALFSEKAWLALQPKGFQYAMSYVTIPDKLLSFLEGDDFVYYYSLTYPTEDRAVLMEEAMAQTQDLFAAGSGRRAKMQFYADCIRDCFDTTLWPETTFWEQVLV